MRLISQNAHDVCTLVDDCMSFLRSLSLGKETEKKLENVKQRLDKINNTKSIDKINEGNKKILYNCICDIFEEIAPEGCYFGSHPAAYWLIGFWDKTLCSVTC